MKGKFLIFVIVVVIAFLVKKAQIKLETLSLPPGYTFNDDKCSLIGSGKGLIGSEDLALGKHSILFITSGDLLQIFENGASNGAPGGIWFLDTRTGTNKEPKKLDIQDYPDGRLFQAHGFDVSNATDRMYVVNHQGDKSTIDVLQITYNEKCLEKKPWSCIPVSLRYLSSISSDIFPVYGINDVVELDNDHVYVTQWQLFSFPKNGKRNPNGVGEVLRLIPEIPLMLFSLKFTTVFLCTIKESNCVPATEEKFVGANGITINNERNTVFVNDPTMKQITVFKVTKDNTLLKDSVIKLPVAADNIEYDDQFDEIVIGTIPDIQAIIEKMKDPGYPIPGGMLIASKSAKSGWSVRDTLEHDGTKLSQISAAAKVGQTVFLGSPGSEGILLCTDVIH